MEALILRRNYPVPVTFADLRRAAMSEPSWPPRNVWHAALKSATGATDDVYAVVDGREVRVAVITTPCPMLDIWSIRWLDVAHDMTWRTNAIDDLCEAADEQGYWERPHEVRLDMQERVPSIKSIDAVVQRSLIEAEVRR